MQSACSESPTVVFSTNETLIRLEDVEEMLRGMAYNGGPWTYYSILRKLREIPRR
jgi:hypothetical protein